MFVTAFALAGCQQVPTAGNVLALGTTNKLSSFGAAGLSASELEYSASGSYGGGTFALDFTDRTFELLVNANGAPNKASCFQQGELVGEGELSGYAKVPAPNHPYMNRMYLPPSLGGGAQGSLLIISTV